MSTRSTIDLGGGVTVETFVEKWIGRAYIGYSRGVSAGFSDVKALRRFLGLPAKSPSRERLDDWLAGLDPVSDQEAPAGDLQASGFGPETEVRP